MEVEQGQGSIESSSGELYKPKRGISRRSMLIWLTGIISAEVVASGITWPAVRQRFQSLFPGTGSLKRQPSGKAFFSSSDLLSLNSNAGICDQFFIDLQNIPEPAANNSYYAWLLSDTNLQFMSIFLGTVNIEQGKADFSYQGDTQHTNLLATMSRFLITEEPTNVTPSSPSLNPHNWRFYASFSQVADPTNPNHYSLYDHLRHLLSDDPKVKAAGLTGGLDIWLYKNAQDILVWADSASDLQKSGNVGLIRRQLARIIDYLDGTFYNQHDLPGVNLYADPTVSKLGLLTFDTALQVNNPGYLYHIGTHLRDIAALPQSDAQQKALAIQINEAINAVNSTYQTVRTDILQLFAMSDAQLLGNKGRPLLDEVATLANNGFVGEIDSQGRVIEGVVQIHYSIQRLATFDIKSCLSNNSCPSLT